MVERVRAFRGATTVEADDPELIRAAVAALVGEMMSANDLTNDDLISGLVTTTPDLTSMFAAKAVRQDAGFGDVPLLGALEADVDGATKRCIRVMVHAYTDRTRPQVVHVYHHGAKALRPDLGR